MTITFLALLLIVGNAAAYSLLDLLRKMLMSRVRATPLLVQLSLGQLPVFLVWTLFAGRLELGSGYVPLALVSIVLNIGANLLFLEAVRVSPLSLTVPVLALTPVFTTLLAIPLLGEVPTPVQFAGIVVVVVGAFRLNLEGGVLGSFAGAWRAFARERGSVMMAAVALLWALATPLDKLAMARANVPFHALVLNGGIALGLLAVLVWRRRLGELVPPPGTLKPLTLAIVASVVGLGLLLVAITIAWVGFVETGKRAIGSTLALVLGWHFFDERINANKLAAVGLMIAGVAMIVLAGR